MAVKMCYFCTFLGVLRLVEIQYNQWQTENDVAYRP